MASFWNHSELGTDEGQADNFYLKLFKKNLPELNHVELRKSVAGSWESVR